MPSRMPQFHRIEQFVLGKTPDIDQCEDVVEDGDAFAVVADGATDKSGRTFLGKSGGRLAAEIVCDAVAHAPAGVRGVDLVRRVNEAFGQTLGLLLDDVPVVDFPTASFCALDKVNGRVVRVGDTSWMSNTRSFVGSKTIDRITADARAALLSSLVEDGADVGALLEEDPGRAMVLPLLRLQALWRNHGGDSRLVYGAIDGRAVPQRFIEEWDLGPEETVVVLASDGYPLLAGSLDTAEAQLELELERDPLRIGTHPSTKGVRPGNLSYDDRAFIKLARTDTEVETARA